MKEIQIKGGRYVVARGIERVNISEDGETMAGKYQYNGRPINVLAVIRVR